MSRISKYVLEMTGQSIHEDDYKEIFKMLTQARDHIHWELDSPPIESCGRLYKYALRYVLERKVWAVFWIRLDEVEQQPINARRYTYYEKYSDALDFFKEWCVDMDTDLSKIKFIRPVLSAE